MKSLDLATNEELERTAEMVMETVSMITRAIRQEMRRHRPIELSMQQFRTLGIVERHSGASLSFVSGHLGLTTASASKLVDGLVKHGLLSRADSPEDRRRVALNVTPDGQEALRTARKAALGRLGKMLESLSDRDRSTVISAMGIMRDMLALEI